ncbi:MAG: iscA [Parachlamydiales bacterium]|nr:iscA [Parachlamydiales bacterium]
MPIVEIFDTFGPKSHKLKRELVASGVECSCCRSSHDLTLEEKLSSHPMTDEQINTLVSRLNAVLDEPDEPAIQMTEEAARQFRSILVEEKKIGWALRFGIQDSGCCGYEYFLDYSEQAQTTDQVFESHGIQIHVDPKSAAQLDGTIIDYAEGKHGAGFKIVSPSSGCGCSGNSGGCCSSNH